LRLHRLAPSSLSLDAKLFVVGALLIALLHLFAMALFGWPQARSETTAAISVTHGVQWGLSGMLLLLVGAVLVGPYGDRTLGQNMKTGARFLYGVFLGHAVFDYCFGGDPVDPALYSASAAAVVWFGACVYDLVVKD
jgi:hypothetical protein